MKVVGIGISAGGKKAMEEFLPHLPDKTGAAYVLIQHLSPNRKSIMDELLSKYTNLPITVVDKATLVEPDHLYLIPYDKNLTFEKGMIMVHERDKNKLLNLPIDKFFHSLGNSVKNEAIGVVLLPGSGTDGSRGVKTIKENGGIILIQEPETAQFTGMPDAVLNLSIADEVGSPSELAQTLGKILTFDQKAALDPKAILEDNEEIKPFFNQIIEIVSDVANINFTAYREPTLIRRIENSMVLNGISTLKEFTQFIKDSPDTAQSLYQDFLIGVTQFFRDKEAFEQLSSIIIPSIVRDVQENSDVQEIRMWVPACSTGEEAYSLAILFYDYIQKNKLSIDFKVFASDVDKNTLNIASAGQYPHSIEAEVPLRYLTKYFIKESKIYQVNSEIRDRILFASHNAISDPPFIKLSFVSCRNFLIYLKPETQQKLLETFHFALNHEGYLFLGPSERIGDLKNAYDKVAASKWNLYRKKESPHLTARSNISHRTILPPQPRKKLAPRKQTDVGRPIRTEQPTDPFISYLVERFAPISIFVNKDLDIIYLNGEVDRILSFPKTLASFNLEEMTDFKTGVLIKNGVRKALVSHTPTLVKGFTFKKNRQTIHADLQFERLDFEDIDQDIVLIRVTLASSDDTTTAIEEISREKLINSQVRSLERELKESKKQTQKLVDELEATNEELQASNRELMASNEELQSTNEELQSVNEELYTVNSELQAKNEALSVSNNDVNNLLKSTEIGTIFLDNQLQIRKFTPAIRKQFNLLSTDIGRPITNFASNFNDLDIGKICNEVFSSLRPFEKEVVDQKNNHYFLRILPYRTGQDAIKGLVATFVDINELYRARLLYERQANKFNAIFNYLDLTIFVVDRYGKITNINHDFGAIKKEFLMGNYFSKILEEEDSVKLDQAIFGVLDDNKPRFQFLEVQSKTNKKLHFELTLLPIVDINEQENNNTRVLIIAEDITSQKEEISNLENSLQEYIGFMDNAVQQIILVEKDTTIRYVNKVKHTGLSKEEIIGRKAADMLQGEEKEKYLQSVKNIFEGKPFEKINFTYSVKDGTRKKFHMVATPVILNKKVEYVAIISQEILEEES